MLEENNKEMLYLIGVFNEFVLGEKLEARAHVEDAVDAVDYALVRDERGYLFEGVQQDLDLLETYAPAVDAD
jgi:hypothetical protein